MDYIPTYLFMWEITLIRKEDQLYKYFKRCRNVKLPNIISHSYLLRPK